MTALSGVRSILHINEKGGKFGGTEEYITNLAQLLSPTRTPLRISSHLIYEHLHGTIPSCIESHRKIAGLGSRDGNEEVGHRVLCAVSEINPDIVYIHNIFDSRIIQTLDKPDRKYLLLWYIHDHFPTCLTELRALKQEPEIICYQPLSQACLSNIESGCCIKRHSERNYSQQDLLSRLELLKSARRVDAIIVVSNFMKEIMIKNLPGIEDKIRVLPRQVRPSLETTQRQRDKSRIIVYSGRITYEKGLHLAIEALSHIQIKDEIVFKIAGVLEDGSYWSHCLRLAKKVEENNPSLKIHYLGHLSYKAVDFLYTEADIVVLPSIWGEPLGAVAAEALRNGAAVVASNVGGIDTWVISGKTGLLVKPKDVSSMSEALMQLLSNEQLRRSLANAGKQLINTRFTEGEHLKTLSEVIWECRTNSGLNKE
ncbi:MAG: glycosyltransferase family 4 protein [Xenococcaceae cyanobacterium]